MSESLSGQPSDPPAASPIPRAVGDVPFELSQEPVTLEGSPETAENAVPAPAYEHLGELPATYGTQSVYLVAYDPHRLFAYWDIDWISAPNTRYALNICRADGEVEARVDISAADPGRYVDIRQPGGTYYVELGTHARDGSWQPAAFSDRVTVPPGGLSGEAEPKFATLPFHLSFQRLLELIQNAMGNAEDLTAALSRLQQKGEPRVATLVSSLGQLSGEQLHTLETLLGKHLDVEGGASPAGDSESHLLRDRPEAAPAASLGSEERLTAEAGGSENLSSGAFGREHARPAGAFGSETLSSGAFGSESLGSGFSAGGSETLSSGLSGVEMLSSELFSSGGFGSETLASFPSGLGGGGDLFDNARAALFLKAMENNLDVLGSLFSAFGSPGGSDGFSAGGW